MPGLTRLRVEGLQIRLRGSDATVVDDVSLDVAAGKILGLVGESGSGKTTVALALLGYARRGLEIVAGRVLLDGKDVLEAPPDTLRALRGAIVAYVPQDPASALNPALRVGAQLNEALKVHPDVADDLPARVTEVLHEAGLDPTSDLLKRYPHQLSGGQQQRVTLAMAFACRPALIVLDEPTTGLDVGTQRRILDTVRSLSSSYGIAAVYVSHDLAVVGQLADQVAVMYAGRIVELGPTDALFKAPAHPYTRGLLAAVPSVDVTEMLEGIEGAPPRLTERPVGCAFAPRCELRVPACAQEPQLRQVDERLVRCIRAEEVLAGQRRGDGRIPTQRDQTTTLLTVAELTAGYGDLEVLSGVSLEVPAQACVAVVGESGSGKTTLARCIVGLQPIWSGGLSFAGEPLASGTGHRSRLELQRIQYIFQNPYTSLNPRKTIGQIVAQPLEHFFDLAGAEIERRVLSGLDDVSLGPTYLNRYPDELSGGERQRVAIARALVVEPELLVCDEVTSALDVSVQAVIVELLRRLQLERHLSMIFITHNLGLVRSIAQTCVVLSDGHVVESGAVDQILERPHAPYTIRLMEDVPRLAGTHQAAARPSTRSR
jgi:peptide/nickel transport system ATP-binding protein